MFYRRFNKSLNYYVRDRRFLKKLIPKISYHKQYETRDFIMKNNKNKFKNYYETEDFKNYYETEDFKNYKPNTKK